MPRCAGTRPKKNVSTRVGFFDADISRFRLFPFWVTVLFVSLGPLCPGTRPDQNLRNYVKQLVFILSWFSAVICFRGFFFNFDYRFVDQMGLGNAPEACGLAPVKT